MTAPFLSPTKIQGLVSSLLKNKGIKPTFSCSKRPTFSCYTNFPQVFIFCTFYTSIVDLTSLISSLIVLMMVHWNRKAIVSTLLLSFFLDYLVISFSLYMILYAMLQCYVLLCICVHIYAYIWLYIHGFIQCYIYIYRERDIRGWSEKFTW